MVARPGSRQGLSFEPPHAAHGKEVEEDHILSVKPRFNYTEAVYVHLQL